MGSLPVGPKAQEVIEPRAADQLLMIAETRVIGLGCEKLAALRLVEQRQQRPRREQKTAATELIRSESL
jgi:hypothetical protein